MIRFKQVCTLGFCIILINLLSSCGGGGGSSNSAVTTPVTPGLGNDDKLDSYDPFTGGFAALQTTINNNAAFSSCEVILGPKVGSSITGRVLYERVPLFAGGLSYTNTLNAPARGVVVEAVQASGNSCGTTVLDTTLSDGNGEYGLIVPTNQKVCVQVRAQMYRSNAAGGAAWDVQLSNNASNNSPYYLIDNSVATPLDDPIRNLLAKSGWETASASYKQTRSAAPFAILDSACYALASIVSADNAVELPTLHFRWSEKNNTAEGNIAEGDVGGAFFSMTNKINSSGNIIDQVREIFLLGDDGVDTDEYDQHVITHEYGHYMVASLSRSDSFGGSHSLGDKLDMTVAFDEGWGDAFSGIVLDVAPVSHVPTPHVYQDTYGQEQLRAFKFNLETAGAGIKGWFNEASVYKTIYNLFDSADGSGFDQLSLSFTQIYNALLAQKNAAPFVSIYSFIDQLSTESPSLVTAINNIAANEFITVNDQFGSGQLIPAGLNANNDEDVSPVYINLSQGVNTTVCSNTQFGAFNKLSVVRYLRFSAPTSKSYAITLTPNTDGIPAIEIYKNGDYITGNSRTVSAAINLTASLTAGEHVMAVYDVSNLDEEADLNVRKCFQLRIN